MNLRVSERLLSAQTFPRPNAEVAGPVVGVSDELGAVCASPGAPTERATAVALCARAVPGFAARVRQAVGRELSDGESLFGGGEARVRPNYYVSLLLRLRNHARRGRVLGGARAEVGIAERAGVHDQGRARELCGRCDVLAGVQPGPGVFHAQTQFRARRELHGLQAPRAAHPTVPGSRKVPNREPVRALIKKPPGPSVFALRAYRALFSGPGTVGQPRNRPLRFVRRFTRLHGHVCAGRAPRVGNW